MAYDANPLQEENQQVSPNVLSPQATQQQMQVQEQDQQGAQMGSGQSATITPGQESGAAQPAQPSKEKPRSGMSANLRQYIQANKPQTQRISGAATKDLSQQAQSIGAQVQRQRKAQQQQIDQNVEQRGQAQTFAKNLLQQASQTGQIGSSDISRFRNLAQQKETFDDVDDLDLTRQDIDAQRLQQTADAAKTAKGQADILRETFSRQGRQYTRGQSGLDRLLLAGDEAARQQVQSGAQAGAEQSATGISDARKRALEELSSLQAANTAFAQGLGTEATQSTQAVQSEIEKRLGQQQAERGNLSAQLKAEADSVARYVQAANLNDQQIRDRIADSYMQTFNIDPNNISQQQQQTINNLRAGRHHELRGDGRMLDQFAKTALSDMVDANRLKALGYNPEDFGTYDQGYGTNKVNLFGGSGSKMMYTTSHTDSGLEALMRQIRDKAASYNRDQALNEAYKRAGIDRATFESGGDLTAANVATQNQRSRYDALRQLAGISNQDSQKYLGTTTRGAATDFDRLKQMVSGQGGAIVDRTINLPNNVVRRIIS